MAAIGNELPKVKDFERSIFLSQDAYESGFRGVTGPELARLVTKEMTINGQRIPSVAPGLLAAGPSGQTRYMEVTTVGTWTYGGVEVATNAEGYETTLWWDGTNWSNAGSKKIRGESGNTKLEPFNPSKAGGYAIDEVVRDSSNPRIKYQSLISANTQPLTNRTAWLQLDPVPYDPTITWPVNSFVRYLGRNWTNPLMAGNNAHIPEKSERWVEVGGVELLNAIGRYQIASGTITNENQYRNTGWINVNVGDTFIIRAIQTDLNSPYATIGIVGANADGSNPRVPSNASDSTVLYTHKDDTIKKVIFTVNNTQNSTVRYLSQESARVDYSQYNYDGLIRINTANNGYVAGEIVGPERMPLTLKMKVRTTSAGTDQSIVRLSCPFAHFSASKIRGVLALKLVSIDTEGITEIPFASGKMLRPGEVIKITVSGSGGSVMASANVHTDVVSGVDIDFTIQVLSLGFTDDIYKHEMTLFKGRRRADVAQRAVQLVNPYLAGQKYVGIGDSITTNINGGYGRIICDALDMEYVDLGWGNQNLYTILSDVQLNKIPRDAKIITITGGTNSAPPETLVVGTDPDSRDRNSNYIGALNYALDYIYANIPTAWVMLITPNLCMQPVRNPSIKMARQAMKIVSEHRAVPILDWYLESGWNEITADYYMIDGVHPTQKGLGYMAGAVMKKFPWPLNNVWWGWQALSDFNMY